MPDIINVALEELARQRYELPGFSTLLKIARAARRGALFLFLENITLSSTTHDRSVTEAIAFLLRYKATRSEWLSITREETRKDGSSEEIVRLDLSFVPDKWWPLVVGNRDRDGSIIRVERRHFELCLFTQIMLELKSGDLAMSGSGQFSDYRGQLVSEAEYDDGIALYGEQASISIEGGVYRAIAGAARSRG